MSRIAGIFISDWRRKLLALGLAFALWFYLSSKVADDQVHPLRIVLTPVERAPEPGTLQVRVPQGWAMTRSPGTAAVDVVEFELRGSEAGIEAFLTNGFSASFDPQLDRLPANRDVQPEEVRASDLEWTRPESASEILGLDARDMNLEFTFERLITEEILLGPHVLRLQGSPPEGYVTLEKELTFGVNQVRLRAPSQLMGATVTKLLQARQAYENYLVTDDPSELEDLPPLLEPLIIDGQNRNDIHTRLRLDPDQVRAGVELLERDVLVTLPVRLSDPTPRAFTPEETLLTIIPDPEGEWVAPEWIPTPMRFVLTSRPEIAEDVNEDWLFRHLLLFLPLDRIPDDIPPEQNDYLLPIEWTLIGLDPEVKREVLRRLEIRFEDPDKRTVTVLRRQ